MVWMSAIDAGMENRIASKAISAGQYQASQTKWKPLLVCPVARRWHSAVKRIGSVLNYDPRPRQRDPHEHPSTDQRIGGNQAKPVREPHVRAVRGTVNVPVYKGKWKLSTAMTELDRLSHHLVGPLGERGIAAITREELQKLLDRKARSLSGSVVTHLRFRLRSIFDLALSDGPWSGTRPRRSTHPSTANPVARKGSSLLRIWTP